MKEAEKFSHCAGVRPDLSCKCHKLSAATPPQIELAAHLINMTPYNRKVNKRFVSNKGAGILWSPITLKGSCPSVPR